MNTKSKMVLGRNLLVAGGLLLIMIASLLFFRTLTTPSFHGKSINHWLAWFDSPAGLSQAQWQERFQKRSEATEALRQMGPQARDFLRRMLQRDSGITRVFHTVSTELKREFSPAGSAVALTPEEARMLRAVEACAYLGRDAQAMVPDLLIVLESNPSESVRTRAAYALGAIGGSADKVVPALVRVLRMSDPPDGNALISLGKYGVEAAPAIPAIVALLDKIDRSIKAQKPVNRNVLCEAVRALHQIAPQDAEKRLPLVDQILQAEQDPFWKSRLAKMVNTLRSSAAPKPPTGEEN